MKGHKIGVGGTYLVRFQKGIVVKATVVNDLTKAAKSYDGAPAKLESTYECRLEERVGNHKKGEFFVAKSRSFKDVIAPPLPESVANNLARARTLQPQPAPEPVKEPKVEMLPSGKARIPVQWERTAPTYRVTLEVDLTAEEIPTVLEILKDHNPKVSLTVATITVG